MPALDLEQDVFDIVRHAFRSGVKVLNLYWAKACGAKLSAKPRRASSRHNFIVSSQYLLYDTQIAGIARSVVNAKTCVAAMRTHSTQQNPCSLCKGLWTISDRPMLKSHLTPILAARLPRQEWDTRLRSSKQPGRARSASQTTRPNLPSLIGKISGTLLAA